LCQGRANLRKILIKEYESIENLAEIISFIEKLNTTSSVKTDRSVVSCSDFVNGDGSEKQELSIFSEDNKINKRIDSNFTLLHESANIFSYEQMVFGHFISSKTTFEFSSMYQNTMQKRK
jgi:hypothetical protein